MELNKLTEMLSQALEEEKKVYRLYAMYYENFLTDKELEVSFALQHTTEDLQEMYDYISANLEEDVLIDTSLIPELKGTSFQELVDAYERDDSDLPKDEKLLAHNLLDFDAYMKTLDESNSVCKNKHKSKLKKCLKEEHLYTKDEVENNRFVKLYKKCYEYRKEHPEMEAYEIANKLCFNPNEDWVQLDEVAKTWADMFVFDGAKDEELIKTVREDIVEMIEEYLIDDEENGDFEGA